MIVKIESWKRRKLLNNVVMLALVELQRVQGNFGPASLGTPAKVMIGVCAYL